LGILARDHCRYGPELLYFTADAAGKRKLSAFQCSIFAAIDLPQVFLRGRAD
jgi:hypothetical protein